MRARALSLTTLACAALTTLTACGGATVDSEDVGATQASTSSSSSPSSPTTSTTNTVTVTSTRQSAAGSTVSVAQDQPASAVESIPQQGTQYSAKERAYLDHLRENGLNIDGVEDQLTATGASVCANDTITRDAVAGQLVEQRRTDMTPETLGQLLSDTARANLC